MSSHHTRVPALLCLVASLTTSNVPATDPPNLVVLLCDDLGYGDLGCYGHPTIRTPHLDRLAANGIRLTDCYAASAVCSSSRAGILTGRNPNRDGIYDWLPNGIPVFLSPDRPTLASTLKSKGYQTALIGKWHLNGMFNSPKQPQPDQYGFDDWMATQNNASPSHQQPTNFVRNGTPVGKLGGFSCQEVASEAVRWLDARDTKQPFYMHVCFHEPHEPVASPEELVRTYQDSAMNQDQAQYFANVTNMDAAVGRIVEALRSRSLLENTFLFFTSDNGPETLKRYRGAGRSYGTTGGLRGMKLHVFEGGIRVPGIIHWPANVQAGQTIDTPVSSVDLLPTVRELAGLDADPNHSLDGSSLVPLLEGVELQRQTPLFWLYYRALTPPRFAIREGQWKLLASWDAPLMREARNGPGGRNINPEAIEYIKSAQLSGFELYDLAGNPEEIVDVSDQHPKVTKRLREQANRIFADVQAEAPRWPETKAFWDR